MVGVITPPLSSVSCKKSELVCRSGGTFRRAIHAWSSRNNLRREGAPLNWRPSAVTDAGNGPPLMRRPSADTVAGEEHAHGCRVSGESAPWAQGVGDGRGPGG